MKRLALLLVVVGCGGDSGAHSDPAASLDDLALGCVTKQAASFDSAFDFAPAVADTLAGWDPAGRWFFAGTQMPNLSSVRFDGNGPDIRVDGEPIAARNDTELFGLHRSGGDDYVALRVSNLRPDGTLRAERAVCGGAKCDVCTAQLVRATHNADEGEGSGLSLVGELRGADWGPGYTFNVRVAGTLAYVVRTDGLYIIDTQDPAHPVQVGHVPHLNVGYTNDVKLVTAGDRRYAILAASPVDIVDVTDPATAFVAGQLPESSHTLFTETRDGKTLAYFGNYGGLGPVYDVTDPRAPVKLGSFNTGSSLLHDLSVVDGIAYFNAWEKGFLVVDYRQPALPVQLGAWTHTPSGTSHSNWTATIAGRHIALHGDEGYNAHLDIVDVDPDSATFMTSIASWQTRPWISIHNLMIFGTKAYFTYYQDGVRVLDLADPLHPTQLGYYNTWDPQGPEATHAFFEGAVGIDVDLARKLVFVADSPRGLLILRDDTP